ncbi:L-ascorbate metabolism protein UlaG, beta-lactamase superfamily [Alteribacillus persepolensis]|uniref:L-ascorbate metabolism protein UlaG, beta-lactamase superfamily n=1 Tax=Alteribacillus persepolensis TaxID=568899 RepID=A0A1G8EDL5_9BACI|nr:MBL fold metallo-hydrolase [Alteribacillus persepolensis]SDH67870.1 L-ascorbate metabolism protein UlaG, beta-lactamase superfamily [Alteribacillus persepolensis]
MNIRHIRNATLVVEYAEKTFLIDPYLADKGAYPPFPHSVRQKQNNPLVPLPISIDDILRDVDAVIVTHLHPDHFDDAAKDLLPKDMPMFVQNEDDKKEVQNAGFKQVEVLQENTSFQDITLSKTKGEHGRGEILKMAGEVCGVVLKHPEEKTLYVAGDTVWYEGVQEEINTHQPDIIVVNDGDNQFLEGGSLVMGKEDIDEVHKAAPHAQIIVVHMEAVNHWTLSRDELKSFVNEKSISTNVFVPDDGDSYAF